MTPPFEELQRLASESGIATALDFLEQSVRDEKNYAQLFEVLKMQVRHRMDLPLMYSVVPDVLAEPQQRELEDGLLNACREVGTLLVAAGQLQQGWMYLQPVGDRELNQRLIEATEVTEENVDAVIDIAVSQGAAPGFGFRQLLTHYGTCNGITTFDTQAAMLEPETQQAMATELLLHLHRELTDNVRFGIRESGGQVGDDESLDSMLERFPTLNDDGAHHIDTTHLASLMRIARSVDSPQHVGLAYDLARYGSQLASDFHYPGQPPFADTYRDHLLYYGALLGKKVDEAIDHFTKKMETVDVTQYGPVAIETLILLLIKVQRPEAALDVMTSRMLGQHQSLGIAPGPLAIATSKPLRDKLAAFYQEQQDLLGFAQCVLTSNNPQSTGE